MIGLEQALKFCGIRPGENFSVAALREGQIKATCFTDVGLATSRLEHYASQGFNLYFCGNPVREGTTGKPKAADIIEGRVLCVDLDPKGDKDLGAERDRISGLLKDLQHMLVFSGRGYQFWVRTNPTMTTEDRRDFLGSLGGVDATHNLDRLMRLPGSVNQKTGELAEIVVENPGKPLSYKITNQPIVGVPDIFNDEAKILWRFPQADRSKRDAMFVLELAREGMAEALCRDWLYKLPGGKAAEDGRHDESYWTSTWNWVCGRLKKTSEATDTLVALATRVKEKPSIVFAPDVLDALLSLRSGPEEPWQVMRAELKAVKVSLTQLDKAMTKRFQATRPPADIRYVVFGGKGIGWYFKTDQGWQGVAEQTLSKCLRADGYDVDMTIKNAVAAPWRFVNEPFQEEELPGRSWNKDGARLAFEPLAGGPGTWDMILSNIGRNLDSSVLVDAWCQDNEIKTGAEYLKVWLASMIQFPKEPTAYLFFYGEQGGGKSLFHEAVGPLFTRGYVQAKHSLTSQQGFNGEIAQGVFNVVEEVDLSDQRKTAYARIKEWTTAKTLNVHAKFLTPYDVANTGHWVQCANDLKYCPVFPGDTRITMILVERVENGQEIPKEVLLDLLRQEAPFFTHTLVNLVVPKASDRLRVPAISTQDKRDQVKLSGSDLEQWLSPEKLTLADDELVKEFQKTLPDSHKWPRSRILRELPSTFRRDREIVLGLKALGQFELTASEIASRFGGSAVGVGRLLSKLSWVKIEKRHDNQYWQIK